MKKMCKGILGVFILAFAIVGITQAYADDVASTPSIDKASTCEEYQNVPTEEWALRYAASVNYNDDTDKFVIKIDGAGLTDKPEGTKKELKKMQFKLVEIKYYTDYDVEEIKGSKAVNYKYSWSKEVSPITSGLDNYINEKDKILTVSNSISINREKLKGLTIDEIKKGGFQLTFEPVEQFDPILKNCKSNEGITLKFNKLFLHIDTPAENIDSEGFEPMEDDASDNKKEKEKWADCTQKYDPNTFEYKFCEMMTHKDQAQQYKFGENKEWPYYNGNDNPKSTDTIKLKCDYKHTVPATTKIDANDTEASEKYYTNHQYIYGSSIIDKSKTVTYKTEAYGDYTYTATCKIKCEEIVEVEYGPPVQAVAGMCFQYKVKVTSRINCEQEKGPDKPPTPIVCTPKPQCKHSWGIVARGGPSEEFDSCVEDCDGGKYTDKCTNKCYKEVYQSESDMRQSSSLALIYEADQVGYEKNPDRVNKYVVSKDKNGKLKIKWKNRKTQRDDSGKKKYADGTGKDINDSYYHQTVSWGRKNTKYNYYVLYEKNSGIPTTKGCTANCYWIENTSKACRNSDNIRYINHPAIYDDYYDANGNTTDYKTYKEKCNDNSRHVCGNYKLKATSDKGKKGEYLYYDSKGNVVVDDQGKPISPKTKGALSDDCTGKNAPAPVCVQTIKSPMEKSMVKANKFYKEAKDQCTAAASCNTKTAEFTISVDYTKEGETKPTTIDFPYETKKDKIQADKECTANNRDTTIIDYNGCYFCNKSNSEKWYMTEWTFPGYWWYSKTREISYNPTHDKEAGWYKTGGLYCLPRDVKDVNTKWYNYYQAKTKTQGEEAEKYSYNNKVVCPNGETADMSNACNWKNTTYTDQDAKPRSEGGITDYNINATARKFGRYAWNIDISCFYAVNSQFPKEKESDNCDVCESKEGKRIRSVDLTNMFPAEDGTSTRSPGYNWSTYATQTEKDENYTSVPSTYAKWVQTTGTQVYSDQYLDYEFTLTKDIINKLRSEYNTKLGGKYTSWQGNTSLDSVVNYRSKLFRDGGTLDINTSKVPQGDALKCNNMKNYNSTECQEFEVEEGK